MVEIEMSKRLIEWAVGQQALEWADHKYVKPADASRRLLFRLQRLLSQTFK